MLKKSFAGLIASIIAVMGLMSAMVAASSGDSMAVAGQGVQQSGFAYANFTIANGDPNDEGVAADVKVQPALIVEEPVKPNIGAGDDNDKPSGPNRDDYKNFTIANGDPNEEGSVPSAKVQPALEVEEPVKPNVGAGDDADKPSGSGQKPKLNIGPSDPAEH